VLLCQQLGVYLELHLSRLEARGFLAIIRFTHIMGNPFRDVDIVR
jgi:hypothetical protein